MEHHPIADKNRPHYRRVEPLNRLAMQVRPWRVLREAWKQRYLLWQFSLRFFGQRYKGSVLGVIWVFLSPLLMMLLYTFVFGIIFDGRFGVTEGETCIDYALGIFLGLTLFNVVAESIGTAPSLILSHPNLVKRVVFPLEILPVANLAPIFVNFLASLALVIVGVLASGRTLEVDDFTLLLVFVPVFWMSLGLSWLLSAVGTFVRDIQNIVQFLTLVLMYCSAVFFSAYRVQTEAPTAWMFLKFNPLVHGIDIARSALLWDLPIDWGALGYLWATSFLIMGAGYAAFKRSAPYFAEVL